jgi:glycosyltransferase involved in cell wall biosynthesis
LERGIPRRITLHGALDRDAVAAWMARADLLLQPSLFESYGMALAEACAVGLPALSFDVGAAQRLIADGSSGYVVAAGDWAAFAHRLDRLLAQPALRARFEHALAQTPVRPWQCAYAELSAAFDVLVGEV